MLREPHAPTTDARASRSVRHTAIAGIVVALVAIVGRITSTRALLAALALGGAIASSLVPGRPWASVARANAALEQGPVEVRARSSSAYEAVADSNEVGDEHALLSFDHEGEEDDPNEEDEPDEPFDELVALASSGVQARRRAGPSRTGAFGAAPLRVSAGFSARRDRPPHA